MTEGKQLSGVRGRRQHSRLWPACCWPTGTARWWRCCA